MGDRDTLPAPATPEAWAMGCNCSMRDGEGGLISSAWPDWITTRGPDGCPLHGPRAAPWAYVRNDEGEV